jgi:hypothetical protein
VLRREVPRKGASVKYWAWQKATASAGGDCVEVAQTPEGRIAIRDSKNPGGGILQLNTESWQNLLSLARKS